ncbi:MAG: peptidoglycan-associated lipoprotein Pal [Acidobacteria bacterium]|nr:peptidoglycan-associated lipoprotein Pal [Acidobacteriota bacterium]
MTRTLWNLLASALLLTVTLAACAKKAPTVERPAPPTAETVTATAPAPPPPPPRPAQEPMPVPPEPDSIRASDLPDDLDSLNRSGVLKPVFFDLDSSDVNAASQQVLQENAEVLRRNMRWQVTIEGHCDERGTAEYNLALGERRALSARTYLLSLGIPAERVRTVSYGKEFPFDQGHDEAAWSKNRRAHFVITAK